MNLLYPYYKISTLVFQKFVRLCVAVCNVKLEKKLSISILNNDKEQKRRSKVRGALLVEIHLEITIE